MYLTNHITNSLSPHPHPHPRPHQHTLLFFLSFSSYLCIQVNTNGLLSFGMPQPSYLSSSLSLANLPLVAPFLGDVDTRGTGEVFFRQTNNQSLLASVGAQIQMYFMDSLQFLPTSLFIATWSNVGYYDSHTELVRIYCNAS